MKRIAVLASGRGSNFQAIIDRVDDGYINAELVCLITDKPDAYAIKRADNAGIPVEVVDYKSFEDRKKYNEKLHETMQKINPDLFVLAGYMRLLDEKTAREFHGRMINIHPALLPSFTGLHAQRQAVDYGVKVAGCTVHFVDEGMDTGAIILQRVVALSEGDDEEILTEKILKEEHQALPDALRLFCEDRLKIEGRKVKISGN